MNPALLQLRGGTTEQNDAFTGKRRELSVDTDEKRLRVHDGKTAGGHPVAKASEIPTRANELENDAFETRASLSKLSQLTDDVGYWKKADLTKLSQLENDAGFVAGHCTYCSHCSYCNQCGNCYNCTTVNCTTVNCTTVKCSVYTNCKYCSNCSNCDCDCCDA